ncbi:LysR family transcriptional regulator [Bacillus sp. JJ1764]|uniref:LysR family transcriptional regulator n=1 Tax=Bacillus sp. JJ1764 TaxID=3122964 RepID=UPI002FFD8B5A
MKKNILSSYLKSIIQYGNISQAAKALFISQPYLSRKVKEAEEEFGVKLINRDQSPITLTYAGERFLDYLNRAELLYLDLEREMQAISQKKKGRLRLGINSILGSQTLHKLLPKYMSAYPGIKIELVEESAKGIELLLEQRKVDISLTLLPAKYPVTNSSISFKKLYQETMLLVIPNGHRLYNEKQTKITPFPFNYQTLNKESFILLHPSLGLRQVTDEIFKMYHFFPEILLETLNVENAFKLSNSGIGLTIIPDSIKENNLPTKSNFYTIGTPPYKNNVVIAYLKAETLSDPALAFLNLAEEYIKLENYHN